nr:hypothetical protein [uncultured Flavobacterium sp.]
MEGIAIFFLFPFVLRDYSDFITHLGSLTLMGCFHGLQKAEGFEPSTACLEGRCSLFTG